MCSGPGGQVCEQEPDFTGPGKQSQGGGHEKAWSVPTEQPKTDEGQRQVGHIT